MSGNAPSLPLRLAFVAGLAAALAPPAPAATLRETLDRTLPLTSGGEVLVENQNGDISIEVWDRSEVRVQAERQVRASSSERGREAMEELRIDIEATADRIVIETRHPRWGSGVFDWMLGRHVSAEVTYRLTVPRRLRLDAETTNGGITAADVGGRLRLRSTNGNIGVAGASGTLDAATTNGRITAELLTVEGDADLSFHTTNGSITVHLPRDLAADLSASTTNGSIETDFPVLTRGALSRRRLEGSIGGGGGRLALATTNGSIHIRILERR